jgi:uncharacterized protein (TIGR03435 family)
VPIATRAQAPAAPAPQRLHFEVASVKPIDPAAACCYPPQIDPGRFVYNTTLHNLIGQAYRAFFPCPTKDDSGDCAFPGAPAWIYKDRFAINATMPHDLPTFSGSQFMRGRALQINQMLQALLEERFKLKVHWEVRTLPIYVLTIAKNGPKLTPTAGSAERPMTVIRRLPNGNTLSTFKFLDSTTQDFAIEWGDFMDRPVLDRTGLRGNFDFTLNWESEPDEPSNSGTGLIASRMHTGPAMFRAIEDQLGLKLEPVKGPVEVLVIDHVEQPSEN